MSTAYPNDWGARRQRVYKRDDYQCQNCGARGGPRGDHELHAHHIVPKSKGGTHDPSNLTTVCKGCHNAIHNNVHAPTSSIRESSQKAPSHRGERQSEDTITELLQRQPEELGGTNVYYNKQYIRQYNQTLRILQQSIRFHAAYQKAAKTLVDRNTDTDHESFLTVFDELFTELNDHAEKLVELETSEFSRELAETRDEFVDEIQVIEEWEREAAQLFDAETAGRTEEGERIEREVESVIETGVGYLSELTEEAQERIRQLRETHPTIGVTQLDDCPFCNTPLESVSDGFLQCRECHAEFNQNGAEWESVHGNERFANVTLIPKLWAYLADVDIDECEYSIEDLEGKSDSYTSMKGNGTIISLILALISSVGFLASPGIGVALFAVALLILLSSFYSARQRLPEA